MGRARKIGARQRPAQGERGRARSPRNGWCRGSTVSAAAGRRSSCASTFASELRDFDHDDVDLGIRFGAGKYPGLCAHRLFDNVIIPVCSPRLLAEGPPLAEPRDLLHHTLAHIEWSRQGVTWPNWRMWMAAAGVEDFDDSRAACCSGSSHVVQAAIDGNVVALADFAMVANDLSIGRLVRPFALGIKVPPEFAYNLVYPTGVADDPRIVAFRSWILEEAEATEDPPANAEA